MLDLHSLADRHKINSFRKLRSAVVLIYYKMPKNDMFSSIDLVLCIKARHNIAQNRKKPYVLPKRTVCFSIKNTAGESYFARNSNLIRIATPMVRSVGLLTREWNPHSMYDNSRVTNSSD